MGLDAVNAPVGLAARKQEYKRCYWMCWVSVIGKCKLKQLGKNLTNSLKIDMF